MRNTLLIFSFLAITFGCKNTVENNAPDEITLTEHVDLQQLTDSIQIKKLQVGSEGSKEKNLFHASFAKTFYSFVNENEENFVQSYLNEFKEATKDINANAPSGIDFVQHFEIIDKNTRFLSFLIERNTSLGNNYNHQYFTHVYDVKNEKLIVFSDLFPRENFKKIVNTIQAKAEKNIKEKISQNLTEKDKKVMWENNIETFQQGTVANDENYNAFSWDESGNLKIYFNKYQISSGDLGALEVTLSPDEYSDLLSPDYQSLLHIQPKKEEYETEQTTITQVLPTDDIDCGEVPCVALTFDDGPSNYTPQLLDILKENEAKATFFVLGKSAKIQQNTIQRIHAEGHQIGNHSWDHKDLKKLSRSGIEHQIFDTNKVIKDITGVEPTILRPPYGSYNDLVKSTAKLPIILWDLDPLDWKDRNSKTVAERMSKGKPNGILLAHDIHKSTVDAMPTVIKNLKAKGYHLVTIDQLFSGKTLKSGQVYNQRK